MSTFRRPVDLIGYVTDLNRRLEDLRGTVLARIATTAPARIASGLVTFASSITDTNSADQTVTFPEGLFSVAPVVTASVQMEGNSAASARFARVGPRSVTASGCLIRCYADGGTVEPTRVVHWIAIQA